MQNNLRIETERLVLRPLQPIDFQDLCLLDTDVDVRHFFPEGTLTPEQVQRELDRHMFEWEALGFGIFAVIDKKTNRFIGRSGFAKLSSGDVEFGFLFLKDCWNQGYATEAGKALLAWGIKHIPVDFIIGFAPANHFASLRVLEKCGMKYVREGLYQNIPCMYYHFTEADIVK